MPTFQTSLPLSLYIHIPWCVRKCPYCDFNSHTAQDNLQEDIYVAALIRNLQSHLSLLEGRPIISIFFGGGTPSLFSGKAIGNILSAVNKHVTFAPNIEITLEANPGTIDHARFNDFYAAGINRLSLGVQSFQDDKLQVLGRIHNSDNAKIAIQLAKQAGFNNFNIDLMYGLPQQSIEDSLLDIQTALSFEPTHLSWYQLTIEPNTFFHRHPPLLPEDDMIWDMQLAGQQLLQTHSLHQYEVSAYSQKNRACKHNLNYWEFGDYLGIGAGAHSKMTSKEGTIKRFFQFKNPKDYLKTFATTDISLYQTQQEQIVTEKEAAFEFMLNALRLTEGIAVDLFEARTGVSKKVIADAMQDAQHKGLLAVTADRIIPTELGKKFLNNLVEMFL